MTRPFPQVAIFSGVPVSPPLLVRQQHTPIVAPAPTVPVAHVGQAIIGTVGLWVNGVLGYMYQLLRNGVVFKSGNWTDGHLYTVLASDVGSVLSLVVIAQNHNGSGPVASSAPLLVVY
jgi:hypothetical protein